MKKSLNKIKLSLAMLWTVIISFLSKVLAQEWGQPALDYSVQEAYWVYNPKPSPEALILIAIKILQRLLVAIVLVLWIINFIKIRKIDDKIQKKEKIKKTIITMAVMLIIMLLLWIAERLLKEYQLSIM